MNDAVCLLCKDEIEVAETLQYFSQCSNTPFLTILQNVLNRYIPILNSELHLCDNCVTLLNEFDLVDSTYKTVKNKILEFCKEFSLQAMKVDVYCQTEEFENELLEVKKSTDEIADHVEFEFGGTDYVEHACYFCEDGFATEDEMIVHTKVVHHITIKRTLADFICYICNTRFVKEEQMLAHSKAMHPITIKKEASEENYSIQSNIDEEIMSVEDQTIVKRGTIAIGKVTLNLDEFLAKGDSELENNLKFGTDNEKATKKKAKSFIKPIIVNNMNINTELWGMIETSNKYKCKTCLKLWGTEEELEDHLCGGVNKEYPFVCDVCGLIFHTRSDADLHMEFHVGGYPFICSFCKKCFTSKPALRKHVQIHTGESRLQCELCGKSFVHTSSFSTHMRLHAGDKKYKCVQCGLAVFSRQHLARHTRVHTGEKPFCCFMCPRRFAERYNLYSHLKIHKEYDFDQPDLKDMP